MTVGGTTTQSHFETCKTVLTKKPRDAINYLTFRGSCFDTNDTLHYHYYCLNDTEKERLKAFFTH
ncbi:hypothetical protein, partial [Parashewanella curva]|uniref:hypothetical protein n=1 Tax=Parashewanella curva TaxID=2338552 RepID=UPI001A9D12DF